MVARTFKILFVLPLIVLLLKIVPNASAGFDCQGKDFYCANTTHFLICVNFGNSLFITFDDFVLPCPEGTECWQNNDSVCATPVIIPKAQKISEASRKITKNEEITPKGSTTKSPINIFTTIAPVTSDFVTSGSEGTTNGFQNIDSIYLELTEKTTESQKISTEIPTEVPVETESSKDANIFGNFESTTHSIQSDTISPNQYIPNDNLLENNNKKESSTVSTVNFNPAEVTTEAFENTRYVTNFDKVFTQEIQSLVTETNLKDSNGSTTPYNKVSHGRLLGRDIHNNNSVLLQKNVDSDTTVPGKFEHRINENTTNIAGTASAQNNNYYEETTKPYGEVNNFPLMQVQDTTSNLLTKDAIDGVINNDNIEQKSSPNKNDSKPGFLLTTETALTDPVTTFSLNKQLKEDAIKEAHTATADPFDTITKLTETTFLLIDETLQTTTPNNVSPTKTYSNTVAYETKKTEEANSTTISPSQNESLSSTTFAVTADQELKTVNVDSTLSGSIVFITNNTSLPQIETEKSLSNSANKASEAIQDAKTISIISSQTSRNNINSEANFNSTKEIIKDSALLMTNSQEFLNAKPAPSTTINPTKMVLMKSIIANSSIDDSFSNVTENYNKNADIIVSVPNRVNNTLINHENMSEYKETGSDIIAITYTVPTHNTNTSSKLENNVQENFVVDIKYIKNPLIETSHTLNLNESKSEQSSQPTIAGELNKSSQILSVGSHRDESTSKPSNVNDSFILSSKIEGSLLNTTFVNVESPDLNINKEIGETKSTLTTKREHFDTVDLASKNSKATVPYTIQTANDSTNNETTHKSNNHEFVVMTTTENSYQNLEESFIATTKILEPQNNSVTPMMTNNLNSTSSDSDSSLLTTIESFKVDTPTTISDTNTLIGTAMTENLNNYLRAPFTTTESYEAQIHSSPKSEFVTSISYTQQSFSPNIAEMIGRSSISGDISTYSDTTSESPRTALSIDSITTVVPLIGNANDSMVTTETDNLKAPLLERNNNADQQISASPNGNTVTPTPINNNPYTESLDLATTETFNTDIPTTTSDARISVVKALSDNLYPNLEEPFLETTEGYEPEIQLLPKTDLEISSLHSTESLFAIVTDTLTTNGGYSNNADISTYSDITSENPNTNLQSTESTNVVTPSTITNQIKSATGAGMMSLLDKIDSPNLNTRSASSTGPGDLTENPLKGVDDVDALDSNNNNVNKDSLLNTKTELLNIVTPSIITNQIQSATGAGVTISLPNKIDSPTLNTNSTPSMDPGDFTENPIKSVGDVISLALDSNNNNVNKDSILNTKTESLNVVTPSTITHQLQSATGAGVTLSLRDKIDLPTLNTNSAPSTVPGDLTEKPLKGVDDVLSLALNSKNNDFILDNLLNTKTESLNMVTPSPIFDQTHISDARTIPISTLDVISPAPDYNNNGSTISQNIFGNTNVDNTNMSQNNDQDTFATNPSIETNYSLEPFNLNTVTEKYVENLSQQPILATVSQETGGSINIDTTLSPLTLNANNYYTQSLKLDNKLNANTQFYNLATPTAISDQTLSDTGNTFPIITDNNNTSVKASLVKTTKNYETQIGLSPKSNIVTTTVSTPIVNTYYKQSLDSAGLNAKSEPSNIVTPNTIFDETRKGDVESSVPITTLKVISTTPESINNLKDSTILQSFHENTNVNNNKLPTNTLKTLALPPTEINYNTESLVSNNNLNTATHSIEKVIQPLPISTTVIFSKSETDLNKPKTIANDSMKSEATVTNLTDFEFRITTDNTNTNSMTSFITTTKKYDTQISSSPESNIVTTTISTPIKSTYEYTQSSDLGSLLKTETESLSNVTPRTILDQTHISNDGTTLPMSAFAVMSPAPDFQNNFKDSNILQTFVENSNVDNINTEENYNPDTFVTKPTIDIYYNAPSYNFNAVTEKYINENSKKSPFATVIDTGELSDNIHKYSDTTAISSNSDNTLSASISDTLRNLKSDSINLATPSAISGQIQISDVGTGVLISTLNLILFNITNIPQNDDQKTFVTHPFNDVNTVTETIEKHKQKPLFATVIDKLELSDKIEKYTDTLGTSMNKVFENPRTAQSNISPKNTAVTNTLDNSYQNVEESVIATTKIYGTQIGSSPESNSVTTPIIDINYKQYSESLLDTKTEPLNAVTHSTNFDEIQISYAVIVTDGPVPTKNSDDQTLNSNVNTDLRYSNENVPGSNYNILNSAVFQSKNNPQSSVTEKIQISKPKFATENSDFETQSSNFNIYTDTIQRDSISEFPNMLTSKPITLTAEINHSMGVSEASVVSNIYRDINNALKATTIPYVDLSVNADAIIIQDKHPLADTNTESTKVSETLRNKDTIDNIQLKDNAIKQISNTTTSANITEKINSDRLHFVRESQISKVEFVKLPSTLIIENNTSKPLKINETTDETILAATQINPDKIETTTYTASTKCCIDSFLPKPTTKKDTLTTANTYTGSIKDNIVVTPTIDNVTLASITTNTNNNVHSFEPTTSLDKVTTTPFNKIKETKNDAVKANNFVCTAEGNFIDPLAIDVYYRCSRNSSGFLRFKYKCGKGFYLDKQSVKCLPVEFNCTSEGRFIDDFNIHVYYICKKQPIGPYIRLKYKCRNDYYLEPTKVQCVAKQIHETQLPSPATTEFKCPSEGRFADPNADNTYYVCAKRTGDRIVRFKFKCQDGLLLDKVQVKCVVLQQTTKSSSLENNSSSSSISGEVTARPPTTTESNSSKFVCTEEGKFPKPGDCRRYYECDKKKSGFRRRRKRCDNHKVFDKTRQKCVDSDQYSCDNDD